MEEKNTSQEEVKDDLTSSEEETSEQVIDNAEDAATSDDNITNIEEKLQERNLQEELDLLDDQHKRLQAEYANYRRRTQQEKETIGLFANEKMINELIPVVDSMERAIDACTDKEDNLFKGIDLVYKQLKGSLEKFGVEEIESENQEFDPNLHLAVVQESIDGVEANKVVLVMQKGYKLGSKVIRPAMVKVSC